MKLGELLDKFRREQQITVDELAHRLGTKKSRLEQWLYRDNLPRFEQLPAIMDVLGLSPNEFYESLGLVVPRNELKEHREGYGVNEFFEELRELQLTEEQRELLLQMARQMTGWRKT